MSSYITVLIGCAFLEIFLVGKEVEGDEEAWQ